ncbi:hypothetical protein ACFL2C_04270 [Patescibacteria group bacterium]
MIESEQDMLTQANERLTSLISNEDSVNLFGGSNEQRTDLLDTVLGNLDQEKYQIVRSDFDGAASPDQIIERFAQAGLEVVPDESLSSQFVISDSIHDVAKGDKKVIVVTENLTDYDTLKMFKGVIQKNKDREDLGEESRVIIVTSGENHPTNYRPSGDWSTPYNVGENINLETPKQGSVKKQRFSKLRRLLKM